MIDTEFTTDIWDLELTDEDLAQILVEEDEYHDLEAGTWEGVDFPSPW